MADLFLAFEPLAGWRHVAVTERWAIPDLAAPMRHQCDVWYPDAAVIRVVPDNLNTHVFGSRFATYPPAEAWRRKRKLEFHDTPEHASWLNMAECERSALVGQCLSRQIESREKMAAGVADGEAARNAAGIARRLAIHYTRRPDPTQDALPGHRTGHMRCGRLLATAYTPDVRLLPGGAVLADGGPGVVAYASAGQLAWTFERSYSQFHCDRAGEFIVGCSWRSRRPERDRVTLEFVTGLLPSVRPDPLAK